jgi:hypothetical protein
MPARFLKLRTVLHAGGGTFVSALDPLQALEIPGLSSFAVPVEALKLAVMEGQQPLLLPPVFKDQALLLLLKLTVDVGGGAGLPSRPRPWPGLQNSDKAKGRKGRATMEFLTVLGRDVDVTVKPGTRPGAGPMSVTVQPS